MSTQRYSVSIIRYFQRPDGVDTFDTMAFFDRAPAWEVAPALKQLAKKIHESPPPVILKGQGELL